VTADLFTDLWDGLGGDRALLARVELGGPANALPSVFDVTGVATASVAAALLAVAELVGTTGTSVPAVEVDRRHVARAFACEREVRPIGWEPPPLWDPIAGDYRSDDGWIRLHTNYAHHRRAALEVLALPDGATRDEVAAAVVEREGDELEQAVVDAGGCAAVERSLDAWRVHPQGRAVAAEPLLERVVSSGRSSGPATVDRARPLAGVRVLDLTRVIAGPVATRFLASFGADVLRVDPVGFAEVPLLLIESTAGKRTAELDLRTDLGRATLDDLLAGADVLVSGYRPGALEGLGLGRDRLGERHPSLVTATLDAYGWTGPWSHRRGFDSLVQMSSGITDAGRRAGGGDRPVPLPVQALDHGTGYLVAAAVVRALTDRRRGLGTTSIRGSLARTALWLVDAGLDGAGVDGAGVDDAGLDVSADGTELVERAGTAWGPVDRIRPVGEVEGVPARWDLPPGPLGASAAAWMGFDGAHGGGATLDVGGRH
jgi:crotonobetainyl-CoA:carnitine CoA-transferase CaiB-like acyl-CoA transferase